MNFGERLRTKRIEQGLTQTDIANLVGVKSPNAVSNWEKGKTEPCINQIAILGDILSVSVDWLIFGDNHMNASPGLEITEDEIKLVKKYRSLDSEGRGVIDLNLRYQSSRCKNANEQKYFC